MVPPSKKYFVLENASHFELIFLYHFKSNQFIILLMEIFFIFFFHFYDLPSGK